MPNAALPTVLDVWQFIEPRFGGVGPAAAALAHAVQTVSNWAFRQIALCNPDETGFADGIRPETTTVLKISGPRPIADRKLRVALADAIHSSALCHVHGVWQAHSLAVQSLASKLGHPVIASAHGMLEKWELTHKSMRKAVYSALFERSSLSRSACLRALSAEEANDYRRFGLKCPIAIVPNGVQPLNRIDPATFLTRLPQLSGKDVVLYLSRIHEKKGILNLLEAWPRIVQEHKRAHLLIAGPEYPKAAAAARALISNSKIESSVTFAGTLSGRDKIAALSAARCFCLPSYSEGQSIAVLEALSIGLPVVMTAACNVDGVNECGAGIVGTNHPKDISASLVSVLSASSCSWQRMSDAAKNLAQTRYDWRQIGTRMHAVYQWILGGPKPDHVIQ